jgi:hypothetical protein
MVKRFLKLVPSFGLLVLAGFQVIGALGVQATHPVAASVYMVSAMMLVMLSGETRR